MIINWKEWKVLWAVLAGFCAIPAVADDDDDDPEVPDQYVRDGVTFKKYGAINVTNDYVVVDVNRTNVYLNTRTPVLTVGGVGVNPAYVGARDVFDLNVYTSQNMDNWTIEGIAAGAEGSFGIRWYADTANNRGMFQLTRNGAEIGTTDWYWDSVIPPPVLSIEGTGKTTAYTPTMEWSASRPFAKPGSATDRLAMISEMNVTPEMVGQMMYDFSQTNILPYVDEQIDLKMSTEIGPIVELALTNSIPYKTWTFTNEQDVAWTWYEWTWDEEYERAEMVIFDGPDTYYDRVADYYKDEVYTTNDFLSITSLVFVVYDTKHGKMVSWEANMIDAHGESMIERIIGGAGGMTPAVAGMIATNTVEDKVAEWALKPNVAPQGHTESEIKEYAEEVIEEQGCVKTNIDGVAQFCGIQIPCNPMYNGWYGLRAYHNGVWVDMNTELSRKADASDLDGKLDTRCGDYSIGWNSSEVMVLKGSFAQGENTTASGNYSHAQGNSTIASGESSHAEGLGTIASGESSHAEGGESIASGLYSHSSGYYAIASNAWSFVWSGGENYGCGRYGSHGEGTFNINPQKGLSGLWIGDVNAAQITNAIVRASGLDAQTMIEDAIGTYKWARPNAWRLGYDLEESVLSVVEFKMSNDDSMIFSNVTEEVVFTLSASCFAERIDETSIDPVIVNHWTNVTEGCSINQDGIVTADDAGLYRISANAEGASRYIDIPLGNHPDITNRVSYYVADTNALRKAVNDAALAVLQSATLISSNNYYNTRRYNTYNTFQPRMTGSGWGNGGYAISPHCLMTADHYRTTGKNILPGAGSTMSFNDGAGHTATVTRREWVPLKSWALTNGWTEAELKTMKSIGDIVICRCDKNVAIPDGCIPYFTDEAHIIGWFGSRGLSRMAGWRYPFDYNQASPVVFGSQFGGSAEDGAQSWEWGNHPFSTRPDIQSQLESMLPFSAVHIGDSGKPVFFVKDGQQIVVSQWFSSSGGPDIPSAFPIIKAFVENYGDTLKEAN